MPDDFKNLAGAVTTELVDTKALNLHQRLLAVMEVVFYVQKDRTIGSYKVVTHDAVTAAVRPSLVKNRVLYYPQNMKYVQNGNRTEMEVDIKFVNADVPGDFITVPSLGYGIDASDKGPGKAMSYAVKMALLKALNLETGEDADDGTNVDHVAGEKNLPVKKASGAQITSGLPKTKLQNALRALAAEIDAKAKAGDTDELEGLLNDNVDIIDQCERDLPGWWNSDPNNNIVGLKERIDSARSTCRKAAQ